MLRPQRNGSKLRGYLRSNSYSVPSSYAKEPAKPTTDKIASVPQMDELPIETLKKPLNNYVSNDLQKTRKEDNWMKPLVSISLENANDLKSRVSHSNTQQITRNQNLNLPSNLTEYQMAKTLKKNYCDEDAANMKIQLTRQIKPAVRTQSVNKTQPVQINNFMRHLDDGNSIIAAYLKNNYGQLPKMEKIQQIQQKEEPKPKPKSKAETKLKNLMNPGSKPSVQFKQTSKAVTEEKIDEDIPQGIDEQIQEDYLKQQFQSIKESIHNSASESGSMIKQSIKADSSIRESIKESIKTVKQSFQKSKFSASIPESIHAKDQPVESRHIIQQSIEAYEDDFQPQMSKYQSPLPKKLNSEESLSKSFRKKKSMAGSIRVTEQVNLKRSKEFEQSIRLGREDKRQFDKLKTEVRQLMGKSKKISDGWQRRQTDQYSSDKINTLYNKFKYQIGRFMENGQLEQKIKKLVSFLPARASAQENTTNAILNKILEAISQLKQTTVDASVMQKMQEDYNKRLEEMMKAQERTLRYDMEKRLSQRDQQLKRLIQGIQELKQQSSGRDRILQTLRKGRSIQDFVPAQIPASERFDYKSYKLEDYSEQYSQVSWQSSIDLWDNISDEQKRQIYERNSENVVNYLTKMMMEQLKQQAIERSVDISFEFPPEIENSKKVIDEPMPMKPVAFNRSELLSQFSQPQTKTKDVVSQKPAEKPKVIQKSAAKIQKQEAESYQIEEPALVPNRKVFEKVQKAISKYQRKIKPKAAKIIKQAYELLKDPQMSSFRLIQEMKILEANEVDNQEKEYAKGYEQHILNQVIKFLNNNGNYQYKKLESIFKQRFDHMLKVAKQEYLSSVELAIAPKKKDDSIPKNFNDLLTKYTSKRMEGEQPYKQSLCEHHDNRQFNKTKKKVEQELLNLLLEEAAKEIRMRSR